MTTIGPARLLDVNLTAGTITRRELPEETFRLYPGGSALAAYLLLQEMPAGVEPLGPENLLIFATSPLANTPIAGISRLAVSAKSPLTGGIGDSQSGGFFPAEMQKAGWDAIIFRGKSPRPVYLYVKDDHAELRPAEHLWGQVTGDALGQIQAELGDDKVEVCAIGPAGEKLVRYAAIISMANRANGRTGMGAVMGSKNLKAVAMRGTQRANAVDAEALKALSTSITRRLAENSEVSGLQAYGTAAAVNAQQEAGGLPSYNYRTGHIDGAEKISGETMAETILAETDTCYACAVKCKRVVEVAGRAEPKYGGPEYETVATLGSYCGITDLEAIAEGNQLCNMYGLDTISCGATIAFAMELAELGILTPAETGDPDLRFGNAAAMLRLVRLIAAREGIGELLGEGTVRAAKAIGKGAEQYVVAVKGNDLPAHMPRVKRSLALIYAVNPFGADHQSHEHDFVIAFPEDHWMRQPLKALGHFETLDSTDLSAEKVRFAYITQCFYSITDTVGLCQFVWGPAWQIFGPEDLAALFKAAWGWEITIPELLAIGERRFNLMKLFNAREGFTRAEDWLPARLFEAIPDGPSVGLKVTREELEAALNTYYEMAGWDPVTGVPTKARLEALQLGWASAMVS
ncbi:MAG TPA: aldehyde ferredoxin oxidoreductase family protein [Symbiobacteriaceae bacterium]|nr:aldehyde ferredoxin oxidoreductase family protein [Symbiobacteriaceae bacterium]